MYTAKGQLNRDAMFHQHMPLVRRIAHHMIAKLPPNVELDDLIQVGLIGLTDALTRYEVTQGVQFETFASQRIRGAMLDELRGGDWMSRGARKSQKDIEQAMHRVEQRLGRSPLESEIAAELGMKLDDYQSLLGKVRGTQLVYLEDMGGGDEGEEGFLDRHAADEDADPMAVLRDQRLRAALVAGHQAAARTRAAHHGHVLRARHEPEGNRRRPGRDRVARLPAAQPGHRAAAHQDARALKASLGSDSN